MYQRDTSIEQAEIWYFFLFSYFLLKMMLQMNKIICHQLSPIWQKLFNDYMM